MPNRVVHFEIQVDNVERAIKFYKDVFGWQIDKWQSPGMEYWMVMTAEQGSKENGISGGLLKRQSPITKQEQGANSFVSTIDVKNFDETAKKILEAGGSVAVPKSSIPQMAWIGYFIDTEGNTFGVFQEDKNAE